MNQSPNRLKEIAYHVRKDVLMALFEAGSGHLDASLGLSDIFTALYFNFLRHNPKQLNQFLNELKAAFTAQNG
ncbi:MAG: hypothetical protein ACP5DZ_02340 [Bacteroidales bacterium]